MEQSNRGWSNGEWNSHVVVLIVVSYERSAFKINAFSLPLVLGGGEGFHFPICATTPPTWLIDFASQWPF